MFIDPLDALAIQVPAGVGLPAFIAVWAALGLPISPAVAYLALALWASVNIWTLICVGVDVYLTLKGYRTL